LNSEATEFEAPVLPI